MSIENIVRPFQFGDVFTARIAPVAQPPTTPAEDVVKVWGAASSGDFTKYDFGTMFEFTTLFEESRVTEKVRITNPTDDSQFVDVERIKQLAMRSDTGQRFNFNLNNS